MSTDIEPAWKRNGRAGPFDWWLGCNTHGAKFVDRCMSCDMARRMNADLAKRLSQEIETQSQKTSPKRDTQMTKIKPKRNHE